MAEPRKKKRVRNQVPKPSKEAGTNEDSKGPLSGPAEGAEATAGESILLDSTLVETGAYSRRDDQETVGGQENGRGVAHLLKDQQFMDQVITEMIANRTMESLIEDISDKLSGALEGSPEFRQRLIDAFMANDLARGKVVRATVKALG